MSTPPMNPLLGCRPARNQDSASSSLHAQPPGDVDPLLCQFPIEFHSPSRRSMRRCLSAESAGLSSPLPGEASMECHHYFAAEFQSPSRRSVRRRLSAQPVGMPQPDIAATGQPCRKRRASALSGSHGDSNVQGAGASLMPAIANNEASPSGSHAMPAASQTHQR